MITFSLVSGGTSVAAFFMAGYIPGFACLLLIIIVIGEIIGGIFTATEGSVVAVVYSLILSLFVYKSIKISDIPQILKESAEMTGMYHHIPDWCFKHYVMGNGIYQYSGVGVLRSFVHQQQQNSDSADDQSYSADRWYLYGYDACLSDFYTDFPSGMSGSWYEYCTFWYYDDF